MVRLSGHTFSLQDTVADADIRGQCEFCEGGFFFEAQADRHIGPMRTDHVNQRLVAGRSCVDVESETTVGGLAFTASL